MGDLKSKYPVTRAAMSERLADALIATDDAATGVQLPAAVTRPPMQVIDTAVVRVMNIEGVAGDKRFVARSRITTKQTADKA